MQVALRGVGRLGDDFTGSDFSTWWDDLFSSGSGSGEVAVEGSGLPTSGYGSDNSSGEVQYTIFGAPTVAGPELTPAQMSTMQAEAKNWIDHAFDPSQATKIAQAITAGALVVSGINTQGQRICPSGYAYPNGQCAQVSGQAGQLISGISNNTLMIVGIGFLGLMMLTGSSGGGRRR